MRRLDTAAILICGSYIWLAITVILGGMFYPGYNHITQFMSELGATGAPHNDLVNYFGFFGTELLLFCALGISLTRLPKAPLNWIGFGFLVAYPILISIAVFSPCDFECRPTYPTFKHLIHITTGLCAYLCAIIGLAILSLQSGIKALSKRMKIAGLFLLPILLILLFSLTPNNAFVGAFQRITETMIYIWMVFWYLTLPTISANEAEASSIEKEN